MRRILILAAAAVLIALVSVASALAAQPQSNVYHEQSSEIFPAGTICPFTVGIVIDEVARATTFFDGDGNVTIVRTHVTGGSLSTNLATGRQLSSTWAFAVAFDPTDGGAAVTGRPILSFDPDGGVLRLSAGRQVWDEYIITGNIISQVGRWDLFTDSQFCEALG